MKRVVAVAVVVVAASVPSPAARSAFPGANGKIAFTSEQLGNYEIYVMNADGSAQTPLTDGTFSDENPAWSPDGRKIAYASYRQFTSRIFVMNADGSGETPLTGPRFAYLPKWSPDGRKIAYTDYTEAF